MEIVLNHRGLWQYYLLDLKIFHFQLLFDKKYFLTNLTSHSDIQQRVTIFHHTKCDYQKAVDPTKKYPIDKGFLQKENSYFNRFMQIFTREW
jgi:hypothetical protein